MAHQELNVAHVPAPGGERVALARVAVFVRTLHPNVAGRGFFWREDRAEVEVDEADHDCPLDYPLLRRLKVEGITDYVAEPLRFLTGEIHVATFATRRLLPGRSSGSATCAIPPRSPIP